MAAFTNLGLTKTLKPSYHHHTPLIPKPTLLQFQFHLSPKPQSLDPTRPSYKTRITPIARATGASSPAPGPATTQLKDERVKKVHSIEEFDSALQEAKDKLVVVEFASSKDDQSKQIYPFMVELSRTCNDVVFILVTGDESEATRALCQREKIDEVPHFSFYKSMEKIHEEEAIGPEQLAGDVLYYGDRHSEVVQLHNGEDVRRLMEENMGEKSKLIVLDVGLKHCGPCVKVYPTVVKLSKQMETVVFARMNGDENESCMDFLREMEVIQVPTFLFIRDGKICGRYVGSGKGELIGEILRYQGVRVTY